METKPEFIVVETTLIQDNSKIFDVALRDTDGDSQLIWCKVPSKRTAMLCADSLNDVFTAFLKCGSDREALQLAARIDAAIFNYGKKEG